MNNFVLKGNISDVTAGGLAFISDKISVLYSNLHELELWDEFVWGSNGSPLDVDYIEVDVSKDSNRFVVHTDTGGSFTVEIKSTKEVPRGVAYMPLSLAHNLWFRLV